MQFESHKRLNETSFSRCFSQSLKKKWWAKDSLSCGKATAVATVHRTIAKSRLSSPFWLACLQNSIIQVLTSCLTLLQKWWAKMDSNHRPHDYQSCALASWAIGPYDFFWWRLAGSNRWPPACKAGALPAELNPHIVFTVCLGTSSLYPLNWITHRQASLVLTLGRYW